MKWDLIKMHIGQISRSLTLDEQRRLYQAGLEDELTVAIQEQSAPRGRRFGQSTLNKPLAGAYSAILQVEASAGDVPGDIIDAVTAGWDEDDRATVKKLLSTLITPAEISESRIDNALQDMGAPKTRETMHQARASLLRGMIEAQRRAELFDHPLIEARGDRISALLNEDLVMEARSGLLQGARAAPMGSSAEAEASGNALFARTTDIRFSEQIDDLEEKMFADNNWQPDGNRTRHMLQAFAWLTGDKKMSDYGPDDPKEFVRGMARIPRGFKWGELGKFGGMAIPFDPANFPDVSAADRRSNRTINSDLTKLEAAAEILATNFWLPRQGYGQVIGFRKARRTIMDDPSVSVVRTFGTDGA